MRRRGTMARAGRGPHVAAVVITGSVLALAGCSAPPAPPAETIYVTVTATPTPTPTPPPEAAPATEPEAPPAPEPVPNAPAPEIEWGPAYDTGSIAGATGTPETAGDGSLVRYVVVSGDSFFDIAQRFDLPQQQLLRMNPQIHDFGETVYIGQVINLDWTQTG